MLNVMPFDVLCAWKGGMKKTKLHGKTKAP